MGHEENIPQAYVVMRWRVSTWAEWEGCAQRFALEIVHLVLFERFEVQPRICLRVACANSIPFVRLYLCAQRPRVRPRRGCIFSQKAGKVEGFRRFFRRHPWKSP